MGTLECCWALAAHEGEETIDPRTRVKIESLAFETLERVQTPEALSVSHTHGHVLSPPHRWWGRAREHPRALPRSPQRENTWGDTVKDSGLF
jgi:hypothetical protein